MKDYPKEQQQKESGPHTEVDRTELNRTEVNAILSREGIDPGLSAWVLNKVRDLDRNNSGGGKEGDFTGLPELQRPEPGKPCPWSASSPSEGGNGSPSRQIMDISRPRDGYMDISVSRLHSRIDAFHLPPALAERLKTELSVSESPDTGESVKSNEEVIRLDAGKIRLFGLALLPRVSYGVLNGGSATSYADEKKNNEFHSELFRLYRSRFESQAELCRGKAKGITPAYLNPDGTPGFSFMEMKIRAALLLALEHYRIFPESRESTSRDWGLPLFPLFQMTSSGNDREIRDALDSYARSPAVAPLLHRLQLDAIPVKTGVQPLIAAMEHSERLSPDHPREYFLEAWGEANRALALPGGHGQNFFALEEVYTNLHSKGKRYAYLGNVDNLAYLPDPLEIGLAALSGAPAGFDFSFKTDVDVKGGVLLQTSGGGLSCGDIGPAVSRATVEAVEQEGKAILFNCATGLFDLDYLCRELKHIQEALPLRVSDQDKDAGRYSQAEQVTWEVMSLIDGFIAFGVDKFQRFLAGKLLVENLLTSGLLLEDPDFPQDLKHTGERLNRGFEDLMKSSCGMELKNGRWQAAD
ncbi:UTP--glucose-1-phosphate uridylyltransferase [Salinispira pacifica]|uniref:UTP--glucose-1-phosphate uridylyltransferase n=1 Tax=Salinispira pacifica TaxID=1307761 RepID=V5WKQ6_9SPIO|nr:UTP--glucose-1-phosphate uridylyltransferase [Salinispira pacifica]AHC15776.1 hypothetical protein L21SP2_2423 [Salinispira pacifica]